jgi:phospholipid/cholesterol/gamma-HCH transport system substrate-binding protein
MNEQSMRFRLGVFVLGAFILLAVLITLFGGLPRLFRTFDHYSVIFTDATGVSPGTPVRRSGVRIGEVEKVELDDETGKVRVSLKVDSRYTIRKGDQPVLVRNLLSSDASIDFVRRPEEGKPAETTPIEPGSELQGQPTPGANELAQQASKLLPTAEGALSEMEKVLVRMDRMMPLLEDTLREYRDLARVGRQVLPSLQATSDEFRALAKDTRGSLTEFRRTNDELQVAARNWGKAGERADVLLRTNEEKLNQAVDRLNLVLQQASATLNPENQRNLAEALRRTNETMARANDVMINLQRATQPLAERSPTIIRNLDEGSDKLNKTMTELQDFLRAATRADGTLGRLVNDPSLYNHLDEAACMMTRMLPRVDRILRDVETFADKIARHPESLGLGGVVRPATGLKEAPTYHYPGQ